MRLFSNKIKIYALTLVFVWVFSGCSPGAGNTRNNSAVPTLTSATTAKPAVPSIPAPTTTPVPTPEPTKSPSPTPTLVQIVEATPEPVYAPPVIESTVPPVYSPTPATPGPWTEYGIYSPNNSAYRLNVPNIRQDWEPWRYQNYAFTNKPIEMAGCALTSLTMLLNYYGLGSNPSEMNEWLKNNGGYAGADAIIWNVAISRVAGLENFGVIGYPGGADLDFIRSVIDRGFPVLAEVGYQGTSHYVVLTGYTGTTFYVNDPWYENPGHTLDRTVYMGNLAVAYDNSGNAALTIRSIVLIATRYPIPPRVRVVDIRTSMSAAPGGWPQLIKMPTVEFKAGDPYIYVNGSRVLISQNADITPEIVNGKLMVPLKALITVMGGTVAFDADLNKMSSTVQNRFIETWAGIRTAYNNTWFFDYLIPPVLRNGEILVNAEVLALQLSCRYSRDPATGNVTLSE